jgi:hypothetical protein
MKSAPEMVLLSVGASLCVGAPVLQPIGLKEGRPQRDAPTDLGTDLRTLSFNQPWTGEAESRFPRGRNASTSLRIPKT